MNSLKVLCFVFISCIFLPNISFGLTATPKKKETTLWTQKNGKASFCCRIPSEDGVGYFLTSGTNVYMYLNKNFNFFNLKTFESKNPGFKRLNNSTQEDCVEIDVSKEVSKEFECQYKPNMGYGDINEINAYTIEIYEPPNIFDGVIEKNVSLGSDTTIACKASGTPNLLIKWFNSYKKVIQSGKEGTLELKNITRADEGQYTCVATITNPEKYSDAMQVLQSNDPTFARMKKVVKLNVFFAPTLEVKMYETYSDLGHTEVIKINVKGRPIPKLECDFMQISERRKIEAKKKESDEVEFTVTFEKIEAKDVGEYKCSAKNDRGLANLNIRLKLAPSAALITSKNVTQHSNYYQLQWSVFSKAEMKNVTVEIQREENGKKVVETRNFTLSNPFEGSKPREKIFSHHISDLRDDSSHTIALKACNEHGCSQGKNPAVFKTPVYNGKNKINEDVLNNPATPDPKGAKITKTCVDCSASKLMLLQLSGLLILAVSFHRQFI